METDCRHCYCERLDPAHPAGTLQCKQCRRRFHSECLHTPVLSPLRGDAFYDFKCSNCGSHNEEECERKKMSWLQVVMLALYNLQLGGGGKCGYYRWKEHVCGFIDKNWTVFFGAQRKKTTLWHGTVAGTLSSNCPQKFTSGTKELGETGWWKLTEMKPPVFSLDAGSKQSHRGGKHQTSSATTASQESQDNTMEAKRPRRSRPFSLNAAMELKAMRRSVAASGRSRRSCTKVESPEQTEVSPQVATPTATESLQSTSGTRNISDPDPFIGLSPSSVESARQSAELCAETSADTDVKPSGSGAQIMSPGYQRGPEEMMDFIQSENSNPSTSCLSSRSSSHADLTWDEDSQASLATSSQSFTASSQELRQRGTDASFTAGQLLGNEGDNDDDDDFEIDPGSMSLSALGSNRDLCHSPVMEELMQNIEGDTQTDSSQPDVTAACQMESGPEDTDVTMDSEGPSEREEDGGTSEEEQAKCQCDADIR